MDDLRKSISAILYERVTSPMYGTLIVTWCLWNWQLLYITFFVGQQYIHSNGLADTKLDYLIDHAGVGWSLILFPIISTFLLITLIPYVSNEAYYKWLKFKQKRVEKKKEFDRKVPLSLEESVALLDHIDEVEEKYKKRIATKDSEIKILKTQADTKNDDGTGDELKSSSMTEHERVQAEYKKEYDRISESESWRHGFSVVMYLIQNEKRLKEGLESSLDPPDAKTTFSYMHANGLLQQSNQDADIYYFTPKGDYFYKRYVNETFFKTHP